MTTIQHRRGTATQWTAANPVLASGEIGFETDTGKFKFGTGSSAWSSLAYAAAGGGSAESITHIQSTPAATWTVNHGLGRFPASVLVVVGGEVVDSDVEIPDVNTVVITFASPQSGRVELI